MTVIWEHYIDVPGKGDPALLDALEQRMGIILPRAIRQVLLDHAGDATMPDSIPVGLRSMAAFGTILYAGGQKGDETYTYSIEFVLGSLAEWHGSGEHQVPLFPFATDTASGYFCLDYRISPSFPPIVFIDFNYDFEESSAILSVADDWEALLSKLR